MLYKEKLKELREENNLRQEDVANILGIKRGLYSQYEIEYSIIPVKHLIKICNYFNVSLDYILGFNKNKSCELINLDINSKTSGQRLKQFRKDNKITQDTLATFLNTNRSVIANYERGRNFIATPFLYSICNKYHVSADYLLGRIDSPMYLK